MLRRTFAGVSYIGKNKNEPTVYKPTIISGFNNDVLRKWFVERLEGRAILIKDYDSGSLLQETALAYRPDILIIMRTGEDRGLPEAGQLAQWGLENSFKVVLIIGEKDEEWEIVDSNVKDAGGYVISWGRGEERSSFYMMNVIMNIIKELAEIQNYNSKNVDQEQEQETNIEPPKDSETEETSEFTIPAESIESNEPETLLDSQRLPDTTGQEIKPDPVEGFTGFETSQGSGEGFFDFGKAATSDAKGAYLGTQLSGTRKLTQPKTKKTSPVESVLLATGHPSVDDDLKHLLILNSIEIAGECYDRRVVDKVAKELKPGIVVVSPYLKGEGELIALIRTMREDGVRVVALPGDAGAAETRELVKELIPLGVYDFVFDQVTAESILERLMQPAHLGDISRSLSGPAINGQTIGEEILKDLPGMAPENPGLWTRLKRRFRRKGKEQVNREKSLLTQQTQQSDHQEDEVLPNPEAGLLDYGQAAKSEYSVTQLSGLTQPIAKKTGPAQESLDCYTIQDEAISDAAPVGQQVSEKIDGEYRAVNVTELSIPVADQKDPPPICTDHKSVKSELESNEQPQQTYEPDPGEGLFDFDKAATSDAKGAYSGTQLSGVVKLTQSKAKKTSPEQNFTGPGSHTQPPDQPDHPAEQLTPTEQTPAKSRVALSNLKIGAGKLANLFNKTNKPECNTAGPRRHPQPDPEFGFLSSGAIGFVSPWRPGLAGRLAAATARYLAADGKEKIAVIGMSGCSTVAGHLGIEEDELIMSDWRVPGSQAPLSRGNLLIWAVDPAKSLYTINEEEMGLLLAKAQSDYPRVIIDCGDGHQIANELLYQDVTIMYILPGNDVTEQNTAKLWLNRLQATGKNVVCGIDLRDTANPPPEGLNPEFVIRSSPEEALWEMTQKYNKLLDKAN